jgi:DNA-binding CsgD family transcriptional regulator
MNGMPADVRAFVEQSSAGHVLVFAVTPSGDVVSPNPAVAEVLGEEPAEDLLGKLQHNELAEDSVQATVLTLADGTRLVGLVEDDAKRLERLLRRFAEAHRLTPAERAALTDIATGCSAKESAQRLSLSPETVRARRKRIFRKVGVDGCGAILARLLRES